MEHSTHSAQTLIFAQTKPNTRRLNASSCKHTHYLPPLPLPYPSLLPSEHLSPFPPRPSVFSVDMFRTLFGRKDSSLDPQTQIHNPNQATAQNGNTERIPPLPPNHVQVPSLIEDALRDGETDRMLSLSKEDAQTTLDIAWDLLGSSLSQRSHTEGSPPLYGTPVSRSILRRISLTLALNHDILPSSTFLRNIKRVGPNCRFRGALADVYYAELGDVPVALKKIRIFATASENERQEKMKALYVETLLWKGLSHPNVLPFLGVSDVFKDTICMVLLWRPTTIRQHRTNFRDEGFLSVIVVNRWLYQIALGLAYLHEEGVIHGDLHGGNILVDEKGTPQLAGFGMAVIADATSYVREYFMEGGGAVRWTAPELLDPESAGLTSSWPTKASDVYSFACLSIELYTGEKPFPALGNFLVPGRVLAGERPPRPSLPEGKQMRSNMWELIESCWDSNPQARPLSRDIPEQLIPIAPIKTLAPTYEVVELPMKRENQRVLFFWLSENYVVILIQFSIQVYSLDDLVHHNTLDVPSGRQFYHLAVVRDTIAVCSRSSTDPRDRAIHIWDLPGRHCGLFSVRANYANVAAVKQRARDSNTHATRPTFLVFYGWDPYGIGALTAIDKSLVVPVDAVSLEASEFYQSFSRSEEADPSRDAVALGGHALAWCDDSRIRQWAIADGSCTRVIETRGQVKDLFIDPLDKDMVCATVNGQVVVWDFDYPSIPHAWTLEDLNMRPENQAVIHLNHVIRRDQSGKVHIWAHGFANPRTLSHGDENIVTFLGIQRSVITISTTKLLVWDIVTGTELQSFDLKSDGLGGDKEIWGSTALQCQSNGRGLAIWGGERSQKVCFWRFNETGN